MDFVVGLPPTVGGFYSIWLLVYQLTEFAHFIPVKVKSTAKKLAQVYISQIVRHYDAPMSIVLDCSSLFMSHF